MQGEEESLMYGRSKCVESVQIGVSAIDLHFSEQLTDSDKTYSLPKLASQEPRSTTASPNIPSSEVR